MLPSEPLTADANARSVLAWLWLTFTVALGCAWVFLQCLPFLNPGDHLWQQEVTQYQGNLSLLCLGMILITSPLNKFLPALVRDRRWLGLLAFGFAVAHALSGFTHTLGGDWQGWEFLGSYDQFALLLGVISLLFLSILAISSNESSVQWLGTHWKVMHRWLFYPAVLLGVLHTLGLGVHYRWDTLSGQIWIGVLMLACAGVVWLRWQSRP